MSVWMNSSSEPIACSGEMYAGVPKTKDSSAAIRLACRVNMLLERPKSVTFTEPSASIMMLSGLMSQWMSLWRSQA